MKRKDFLSLEDVSQDEFLHLMDLTRRVKAQPQNYRQALAGQTLGMIFEKSSTRTRVSFEVGMYQLGGHALFLSRDDIQLGRGETIEDTARVLSRYVQALMCRTFGQERVAALARHATVPVINGLSDFAHPCQALADYFTVLERFHRLSGVRLTYVGDGNNVAHSLIEGAAIVGAHITLCCPPGREPNAALCARASGVAKSTGGSVRLEANPAAAVAGADAVYTDVWVSMGQEKDGAKDLVRQTFGPYQVNRALFERASEQAIFLHCLPAHRGEEVTDDVADHVRSAIFDQAENRMHTEKALLLHLLAG